MHTPSTCHHSYQNLFLESLTATQIICSLCGTAKPIEDRSVPPSPMMSHALSPKAVAYPFSPRDEIGFQYPPFLQLNSPMPQKRERLPSTDTSGTMDSSGSTSSAFMVFDTASPTPLSPSRRSSFSSTSPLPSWFAISSSAERSPFNASSACASPPPSVYPSPRAELLFSQLKTPDKYKEALPEGEDSPSLLFYSAIRAYHHTVGFDNGRGASSTPYNLVTHLQHIQQVIEDNAGRIEHQSRLHTQLQESGLLDTLNIEEQVSLPPLPPLSILEKELTAATLNPLRLAISLGYQETVIYLLSLKQNMINFKIEYETPLLIAVNHQKWAIAESLLSRPDCEANHVTVDGNNALMIACANNAPIRHIKQLIPKTANINHRNIRGNTALLRACATNAPNSVLKLLLKGGARCDIKNHFHYTAVMFVCAYTSPDFLLMQNAQNNLLLLLETLHSTPRLSLNRYLDQPNNRKQSAFERAEEINNTHYLEILETYGASVPNNSKYEMYLGPPPKLILPSPRPCPLLMHVCQRRGETQEMLCAHCTSIYEYTPHRMIFLSENHYEPAKPSIFF
jgi:ankyrin repeat protein